MDGNLPRREIRSAARRGRALFFDRRVGCSRCHGGPHWTVSGSGTGESVFDVGTGKKMDVPSLLHLWDTAPYLSDGRAGTLGEVLTVHNRGDRHGRTSHLTRRQIDDLVSFLLAPYHEEEEGEE
jgi:cytochrome c peroxidase